jgi:hypothetical protein
VIGRTVTASADPEATSGELTVEVLAALAAVRRAVEQ